MTRTRTLIAVSDSKNSFPEFWKNSLKKKGYSVIKISNKRGLHNLLSALDQEGAMARPGPLVVISDCSYSLPEYCGQALEDKGCRIIRIPDKTRLLNLLSDLLPDLIVTDIQSQSMDGLELLEEIKICCRTRDIPVIVTSDLAGLKGDAMKLGAREFLIRPFGTDEFMRAVESAINRSPWYDG